MRTVRAGLVFCTPLPLRCFVRSLARSHRTTASASHALATVCLRYLSPPPDYVLFVDTHLENSANHNPHGTFTLVNMIQITEPKPTVLLEFL